MIPVRLDAKRDKKYGGDRVEQGEQQRCLERMLQVTPVGPAREDADNSASQHAGEQVGRSEDGDQCGGLVRAGEVLPAQVANQDENAADTHPQDGDAPGFVRSDCWFGLRECVLNFPHHGGCHLDRPVQRAEQRQKSAHEIKRTQPRRGGLHERRLQVQQVVAVRHLVRLAKDFGPASHEHRAEKQHDGEAQRAVDQGGAAPLAQPNAGRLVVDVHRHGAWLPVGGKAPLLVTQVGDISEIIVAGPADHADVSAEFDPDRPLGNVGVFSNPIRVNGRSDIDKTGQQIGPFRVDQKQGNCHGEQHQQDKKQLKFLESLVAAGESQPDHDKQYDHPPHEMGAGAGRFRVQQTGDQRAQRPGVKADPDRERHDGQQQEGHREPSTRAGQFRPSLERVRPCQHHVAGGGENQRPLEHTDQKKQAEQLITEQRPAPGGKDEFAGSDGQRGDDRPRPEDGEPRRGVPRRQRIQRFPA